MRGIVLAHSQVNEISDLILSMCSALGELAYTCGQSNHKDFHWNNVTREFLDHRTEIELRIVAGTCFMNSLPHLHDSM